MGYGRVGAVGPNGDLDKDVLEEGRPREVVAAALDDREGDERVFLPMAVEKDVQFRLCFSAGLQDAGLYDPASAPDLVAAATRAEAALKAQLRRTVPEDLVDDHYRSFWGLVHGLAARVIERVFRRVDPDAERVEVALRALALHVGAACGSGSPTC